MIKHGILYLPEVDQNELRARLGCPIESVSLIPKCLNALKSCVSARFVSRFCDIKRTENGIDLGFCEITSKDLIKNLSACNRAAVFAVTLGSEVDRLLIKLGKLMPSEQFVTDAIASALSETACDEAEKLIFDGLSHAPRFSPGYGDLPLELQKPLLNFLDAEKTVGITLSSSLLMTPTKSITAIAGILE
ncbi:MAG: Vitamin B12 dependent methionine synthase activation subunit [Clostridia bacterium]|nr:Vitamin B12 dependent methionine synthase activation subunit [Clostridia bacterium]